MLNIFIFSFFAFVSLEANPSDLDRAFQLFQEGEIAESVEERVEKWNAALEFYSLYENTDNGAVLYNIGNCYFHLEEYAWASWYYLRALKDKPRDPQIIWNLNLARKRLALEPIDNSFILRRYYLSYSERYFLILLFSLFLLFTGALYIWKQRRPLLTLFTCIATAIVILLGSLGFSYYLAPIEGLVIRSSYLFMDAGAHYARVSDIPIRPGERVLIHDKSSKNGWQKVTVNDQFGYVPKELVKLID